MFPVLRKGTRENQDIIKVREDAFAQEIAEDVFLQMPEKPWGLSEPE